MKHVLCFRTRFPLREKHLVSQSLHLLNQAPSSSHLSFLSYLLLIYIIYKSFYIHKVFVPLFLIIIDCHCNSYMHDKTEI